MVPIGKRVFSPQYWKTSILAAINNRSTRLIVRLDGFHGSNVTEMVDKALVDGRMGEATGRIEEYGRTNWEIYRINEAGRLRDVIFTIGDKVVKNPF
jgi:hypothetical protein